MRNLMSVVFGVCAAARAVAHGADTIAFDSFADGTAGASAVGDTVTLTVQRGGSEQEIDVVLGAAPTS